LPSPAAGIRRRSARPERDAPGLNVMKLDIHCVRTHWIRGFSTLRRRRRAQHPPREQTRAPPAPQVPVGRSARAIIVRSRSATVGSANGTPRSN